jgi:transcriptional regulator with XRE-family HTH domain
MRKQRELSQERLGEAAGLSGKFIGEVERGEKSISVDSLHAVASALDSTMADLLGALEQGSTAEQERLLALARSLKQRDAGRAYQVLRALVAA